MREAEYGGAAFMVPAKNRPELVERMRAKGLTNQEIADTSGVSEPTVRRDLSESSNDDSEPVTNSRGQQRPATYTRTEDDDVIDAEIVPDDEPATPQEATDPAPAAGRAGRTVPGPQPTSSPPTRAGASRQP